MKRYNISDVAKILNVSSGLLRHYEKLGLIRPDRDENGYRCFNIANVNMLFGVRRFRNMGFTLDDVKILINSGDYHQVKKCMADRIEAIENEIEHKKMLVDKIKRLHEEVSQSQTECGRFRYVMSPEVFRLNSRINDCFILQNMAEALEWIDQMPLVSISPQFPLESVLNDKKDVNFGFAVPKEEMRKIGLPKTEKSIFYPSVPCITTVIYSMGDDCIHSGKLHKTLDYINNEGYEPSGDPWGITLGKYNENGKHKRMHRIYFPVAKKKNNLDT